MWCSARILCIALLALSLQNEGPSYVFRTKRNVILFVSGDAINSHTSNNASEEEEEEGEADKIIIVNNAIAVENDDESNERKNSIDAIKAVDNNGNVVEDSSTSSFGNVDKISAMKDEISNDTKNDGGEDDIVENGTVQVIQQEDDDNTTKIDEVDDPILVDEVIIEEPVVENGLLVLDHGKFSLSSHKLRNKKHTIPFL